MIKVSGNNGKTVMLNNAATTPPFNSTLKEVKEFLQTYGAFHRGGGPYANITYEKTKIAINDIRKFLGLGKNQSLLFTHNTSSAINLFIRLLNLGPRDIILTSQIEHTSNNLPWKYNTKAKTIYVNAFDDGSIDYHDLEDKVENHKKHLKLITITGASNLSGYVPDIQKISRLAHQRNALLFVDAAQLAPHRPINMREQGIDALAFSAHKLYAPFGLGVLAVPSKILERTPVDPGGGSIDMISEKNIIWSSPEFRHQTGTWNVTGIIAVAASCRTIMGYGWDKILQHEKDLVKYMVSKLPKIPKIKLYVESQKYVDEHRIGTFVFNLNNYHHALLSAILEHEYGIETRAGTICNHKLVRRWMKVNEEDQARIEKEIKKGNRLASYGIVRVSLGIQNTTSDIDKLINALTVISEQGMRHNYKRVPEEEIYIIDK